MANLNTLTSWKSTKSQTIILNSKMLWRGLLFLEAEACLFFSLGLVKADGCEYVLKGSELFHGSSSSSSSSVARHNPKSMQNPNPIHYVETEEEEEAEEDHDKSNNERTAKQQTEIQLGDDSSPPSSSSSDPAAESVPILNSVLRQLVTCGGAGGRAQSKRSHHGLRIKAVSRLALASRAEEEEEIKCMSENPRFGKSQGEEKEYFSGSIVEAIASAQQRSETEPPRLKKSSSLNEERSLKAGIGEVDEEQDGGGGGGGCVKGKCIPGRKKSFQNK
ncbi:protein UPSTREAM OF FLC-like isoform X2 [Dioscorea cayenensis subsp. rotundata]|uniref:Protein UPSTREAM OF FLC-like isoform X2 n=1 Tax=Dioscorea cayennensis subsp. rotundata TaxID=55577 RepID=A0AB40D3P3_DIOCR|nr:protein UPSTREAM OF FLC-like isoform X2 [Dioscorea cayenensis subsp. rotundata]